MVKKVVCCVCVGGQCHVVYTCILLEVERQTVICKRMDMGDTYLWKNKPGRGKEIPHDFLSMWNLKNSEKQSEGLGMRRCWPKAPNLQL